MSELTLIQKKRGLPWSLASNAANTAFYMLALDSPAFILFLSDLTFTKSQIGFLFALHPFAGLIALFISPAVAQFGLKRTFLTFWTIRKLLIALLLFTPTIFFQFGSQATLLFVTIVISLFALSRAVGITAYNPWRQEYIPASTRGKYFATENLLKGIVGFTAVTFAGYIVEQSTDLNRYLVLIALGVAFGLISVLLSTRIPGGDPIDDRGTRRGILHQDIISATRDRGFLAYLVGIGFVLLAVWSVMTFIPLYMREEVGLSPGYVVWLQTGSLLGGLLSSYFWGWMADRYGGKPVTLAGTFLMLVLPVSWFLIPRSSPWSPYIAMGIAVWQGVSRTGWYIGSDRFLYVNIIPPDKKTQYASVYFAWTGIIGGFSQLTGGRVLDVFEGISGSIYNIPLDAYTLLFASGFLLFILGFLLLQRVHSESTLSLNEFATMFIRGNPIQAAESIIRFQLSKDEPSMVSTTELLGHTNSPLTVDELLESLTDPRFNVRFEAVISVAHRAPDPRLSLALMEILHSKDPALGVLAAWALGRQGDPSSITALREALDSPYRSIRSHSARALATLDDKEAVPLLMNRLEDEQDIGLQIAYASALGKLGIADATPQLLRLLRNSDDEQTRMELAESIANIIGKEMLFIQLLRKSRKEIGATIAQEIFTLQKRGRLSLPDNSELLELFEKAANALSRNDLENGVLWMRQLITKLPLDGIDDTLETILADCVEGMDEFSGTRIEYSLLAIHALDAYFEK